MKFETFQLERQQSTWENKVDYNLSESGVHPGSLKTLFDSEFIEKIVNTELTYGFTEGSHELRQSIASIYSGADPDNIQAFNGSAEANMVAIMSLLGPGDEMVYMVLEGENAVLKNREIMGATDPLKAEEGTLRKKYGISIDKNSVHGSDSPDNAKIEIDFFFKN